MRAESQSQARMDGDVIMGIIIGFAVFAMGYAYAVIYIFIDMGKRYKMYEDLCAEDKGKIQAMGLSAKMREFEKELAIRLQGIGKEEGVDD